MSDIRRAPRTSTDLMMLTRCMAGVLVCRGFPEDEALTLAEKIAKPNPDKALVELAREVGSVFLTLEAHGRMVTVAN